LLGSTLSKAPQKRIIDFLRGEPLQLFLQRHTLDLRGDLVSDRSHHRDRVELLFGITHLTVPLVASVFPSLGRILSEAILSIVIPASHRSRAKSLPHRLSSAVRVSCTDCRRSSNTFDKYSLRAFVRRLNPRRLDDRRLALRRSPGSCTCRSTSTVISVNFTFRPVASPARYPIMRKSSRQISKFYHNFRSHRQHATQ